MKQVYYHAEHNECLTYFTITGKFNPDDITRELRVLPESVRRMGEPRRNGTVSETAVWRFGTCTGLHPDISLQMMRTIRPLLPKSDLLRKIKLIYDAKLTLTVVPLVRYDEPAPKLAPSLAVMRFCLETGTELDIDLYVSCPDEIASQVPPAE